MCKFIPEYSILNWRDTNKCSLVFINIKCIQKCSSICAKAFVGNYYCIWNDINGDAV